MNSINWTGAKAVTNNATTVRLVLLHGLGEGHKYTALNGVVVPNNRSCTAFWTRKAGPKSHSSCSQFSLLLVVLSVLPGPKIPKAFLIHSGAQRNFAHTFVLTLPTDLPDLSLSNLSH